MDVATVLLLKYKWKKFMAAILEMNSTEFFAETYPALGKYIDKHGVTASIYFSFIDQAVKKEGLTYQQCLDDIITNLIDGHRYALEGIEIVLDVIKFLITDKNCTFPEEKLFTKHYDSDSSDLEDIILEDEVADHHIRAVLINTFSEHINFLKYANWTEIEACYWEFLDSEENTHINWLKNIKSCTKYLLETYPNTNDQVAEF